VSQKFQSGAQNRVTISIKKMLSVRIIHSLKIDVRCIVPDMIGIGEIVFYTIAAAIEHKTVWG
jgi:hypothetical protein